MARWTLTLSGLLGILAIFVGLYSRSREPPHRQYALGRNNTILIITDSHGGFSNVVLAATTSLLKNHPEMEVHWASYPKQRDRVERISILAQAQRGEASARTPVTWHTLPGASFGQAIRAPPQEKITAPGSAGIGKIAPLLSRAAAPWSDQDDIAVHEYATKLIGDLDPAVVVVDHMMSIPLATATKMNRKNIVISPNDMVSVFATHQPYGKAFWKYPAPQTGFAYPITWGQIPENIYVWSRIILAVLFSPVYKHKNQFRQSIGLEPITLDLGGRKDIEFITAGCPACLHPLDRYPPTVHPVGPLALEAVPVIEEDPELAAWLSRAPTVLSMMGASFAYDQQRATAMASALRDVLEATELQILWKFTKLDDYDDGYLEPVRKYLESGRLRMTKWLSVDSSALLNSGHAVASIHHGGASCYHEALDAGVIQIILPMWFDLYGFAAAVVDLGIGVWPGRRTAPNWKAEELSKGFLHALKDDQRIRLKAAAEVKQKEVRAYGGRDKAASLIAGFARHEVDTTLRWRRVSLF